jgi:hypothetical protein
MCHLLERPSGFPLQKENTLTTPPSRFKTRERIYGRFITEKEKSSTEPNNISEREPDKKKQKQNKKKDKGEMLVFSRRRVMIEETKGKRDSRTKILINKLRNKDIMMRMRMKKKKMMMMMGNGLREGGPVVKPHHQEKPVNYRTLISL